ncbi:GTPase domain-containing protein [Sediminivirga luteola]|uniref:GTPase domain-containing protein n=1 Tax=Sediminivirga luteola TaxID=1774748 RepID=UPI00166DB2D5|nr:GTPase domain-containing protein [Sediminivirga luteola]
MTETKNSPAPVQVSGAQVPGPAAETLRPALQAALAAVSRARFPLRVDGAEEALSARESLGAVLRDYALPRVSGTPLPLLVVIGGSTGAGKSTLLNSLLGAEISTAGVLRPTTTVPVVVCHPDEAELFRSGRILGGFAPEGDESRGAAAEAPKLRVVPDEAVPAGLAIVDAPDLDSASEDNRAGAHALLAAADFWLFVTTASRYADAAPWELLRRAGEHGTAVALVLDRVPPQANREVRSHLAGLLADAGHGSASLFTIPEVELEDGRLPEGLAQPVRSWLFGLGARPDARERIAGKTLQSVLSALPARLEELSAAVSAQETAHRDLKDAVDASRGRAQRDLDQALVDGRVLHGEVLARWQDFIGSGQFFRGISPSLARTRGHSDAAEQLLGAIRRNLAVLIQETVLELHAEALGALQRRGAGLAALTEHPGAARLPESTTEEAEAAARQWSLAAETLVTEAEQRAKTRVMSFGVKGVAAVLQLAVLSGTARETAGGDAARPVAGTAALTESLLDSLFGGQVRAELAGALRDRLRSVAGQAVRASLTPLHALLEDIAPNEGVAHELRRSATRVRETL